MLIQNALDRPLDERAPIVGSRHRWSSKAEVHRQTLIKRRHSRKALAARLLTSDLSGAGTVREFTRSSSSAPIRYRDVISVRVRANRPAGCGHHRSRANRGCPRLPSREHRRSASSLRTVSRRCALGLLPLVRHTKRPPRRCPRCREPDSSNAVSGRLGRRCASAI